VYFSILVSIGVDFSASASQHLPQFPRPGPLHLSFPW
jgi:hypothetical protein